MSSSTLVRSNQSVLAAATHSQRITAYVDKVKVVTAKEVKVASRAILEADAAPSEAQMDTLHRACAEYLDTTNDIRRDDMIRRVRGACQTFVDNRSIASVEAVSEALKDRPADVAEPSRYLEEVLASGVGAVKFGDLNLSLTIPGWPRGPSQESQDKPHLRGVRVPLLSSPPGRPRPPHAWPSILPVQKEAFGPFELTFTNGKNDFTYEDGTQDARKFYRIYRPAGSTNTDLALFHGAMYAVSEPPGVKVSAFELIPRPSPFEDVWALKLRIDSIGSMADKYTVMLTDGEAQTETFQLYPGGWVESCVTTCVVSADWARATYAAASGHQVPAGKVVAITRFRMAMTMEPLRDSSWVFAAQLFDAVVAPPIAARRGQGPQASRSVSSRQIP